MQNRVYVICMYVWMVRMPFKRARGEKVDSTGYYGIEDPFPDLISKLRRFRGDAECRLLVVKSHW